MDNDTIQYQERTNPLTDEELLEQLPSLIDEESLAYDKYLFLQNFKRIYKHLQEFRYEQYELEKILKIQQDIGAPISEITKIQSQINECKAVIDRTSKNLSDLKNENIDIFQSLVKLAYEKHLEKEWERDLKKLEEWRRNRNNPIQKTVTSTPSQSNITNNKPIEEPLRINKDSFQSQIREYEESEQKKERKEAQQKSFSKAKSVLASIPLSILGFIEIYLIYTFVAIIIVFVLGILSNIPTINTLVELLFKFRQDTPDMLAMLSAIIAAYFIFKSTAEHIIKNIETQRLTMILTGIYLILLNVYYLVVNLSNNDAILANVTLSVLGIILFYKGKTT